MGMYDELVPWYRVLTPAADYEEEAEMYMQLIFEVVPGARTLLELGSGAGHNASHMKGRLECTLSDVSEAMLAASRELNPECVHHVGDMRTLRLEERFDAVFVHDAVHYMTSEEDLRAAMRTARHHLRDGGVAVFAPDCVRETFEEETELHERSEGGRTLKCLEWSWDPDPDDDTFVTEYVWVMREDGEVRHAHEQHVGGHFSRARWLEMLSDAGFGEVDLRQTVVPDVFVART